MTQILPGSVIMYENDGIPILGVIGEARRSKFLIYNDRDKEIELPEQRLYIFEAAKLSIGSSSQENFRLLKDLLTRSIAQSKNINIAELWELIKDPPIERTDAEISKLYFGDSTLINQIATRIALLDDKIYFRRIKNSFEPRHEQIVEQLKQQFIIEANKRKLEEDLVNLFKNSKDSLGILKFPNELMQFVKLLEDLAVFGDQLEGQRYKEAAKILELVKTSLKLDYTLPLEEQAFLLLKKAGHFTNNTNLSLLKYCPVITDSPEAIQQAKILEEEIGKSSDTTDNIPIFTIDDISTLDIDDGLSLESNGSNHILGIHISNVAYYIAPNSDVDRSAKNKATSIYLPEQTYHLLPSALSTKHLSLTQGAIRKSLSLFITIDQNLSIVDSCFKITNVINKNRLTYEKVDTLLENNDPTFIFLNKFANQLEEKRLENGAFKVSKKEAIVTPLPDGGLELTQIEEDSPSRFLVGEMMVLYNSLFARFCTENKIFIPFRSQEASAALTDEEDMEANKIPTGPALDFFMRNQLKRSETLTRPKPHTGLGLKAYTQATSPIRRYLDLVAQRQLFSFLQGLKTLNESEIKKIIEEVSEPITKANLTSRESKRFWLLKYLEKMSDKRKTIHGTIVRIVSKTPLIELEEIFITVPVKIKEPILGERKEFKIVKVIPRRDYVKLEAL